MAGVGARVTQLRLFVTISVVSSNVAVLQVLDGVSVFLRHQGYQSCICV